MRKARAVSRVEARVVKGTRALRYVLRVAASMGGGGGGIPHEAVGGGVVVGGGGGSC